MCNCRNLIFFALMYFTSIVSGFAQKTKTTLTEKQIDSLNELAFEVKRYDINRSISILSATELASEQINYKKGLATAYLYEGGVFLQNGNSKQAITLYYRSLEISREIKDTFNITRAEQQLASAAHEKGQYKEAEALLEKTIATYTKLGKQNEVINATNSIGTIYLEQKQYDSARIHFEQALHESRKLDYLYGLKKSYYNLGLLYKSLQQYQRAENFFDSSYTLNVKAKDKYGIAINLIELSQIEYNQGKIDASISFAKNAFSSADSIDALQIQAQAVHLLIDNYKKQNNLHQVTYWQDKLIAIQHESFEKDKNYSINFIEILKLQEQKNLTAQKQLQAIQAESKNRQIMLTIAVVILLLVFAMGIPFYLNYKKAKLIGLELEQKTDIIEKHSSSLDQLNKAISRQNLKLEEENKMKDKLLSIISHDLRHPLVNTKSILDLINLKLVSPKETNELLEQLESQYVRSLSLLDNLLFWIRGQMKGIKIERAKVNMNNLINSLIDEQRMAIQNKRIKLSNEIDKNIVWYAEKEMLKIIFRNLITNAVKFTPSEGIISLTSVQNDDITYIVVKDSGIGMSKETLEKVNARQYYSSKGTSNEKGSGFGLMLVRDLVQRHKGELLIESEPGRGSTFVVKFQSQAPEQEV
jgi:two-component system sensor histidine kinase/response regulator